MTRKRWLLTGLVVAWGVALVAMAVWSVHAGPPTVRAHSDLATGRQALDRAVETLQTRAGSEVTAELSPYQVTTGCRLTMARRGTEVDRVLLLTVRPGEEPAVLERLAEQAPPDWVASFYPTTGRFRADAGDFVTVVGEPDEPGQLRLTVSTGCRAGTDPTLPG